jgi:hypothetical protein
LAASPRRRETGDTSILTERLTLVYETLEPE